MPFPRGIGLSIFQAFGYGLPVLAGDDMSTHNPEIAALRNGENGWTFKDGNAGSLAEKIRLLAENSELRAQFSRAALKTALEEFTIENMAKRMGDAIQSTSNRVVARRSRGQGESLAW
jgi:glycosyltransferase involved in cell wall biosynthesis